MALRLPLPSMCAPGARGLKAAGLFCAAFLLASAARPTFEVALWANAKSARDRPGVVSLSPHPCGEIAIVRLDRMPRLEPGGRSPLDPELIAETGGAGKRSARWSVPVDYRPIAIRGREILIDHGGQRLWIGTGGRIKRDKGGRTYPRPEPVSCPAGGVHRGSEYAVCAALADVESGRRRVIEYEAPCS
jgi:hypothetical protein